MIKKSCVEKFKIGTNNVCYVDSRFGTVLEKNKINKSFWRGTLHHVKPIESVNMVFNVDGTFYVSVVLENGSCEQCEEIRYCDDDDTLIVRSHDPTKIIPAIINNPDFKQFFAEKGHPSALTDYNCDYTLSPITGSFTPPHLRTGNFETLSSMMDRANRLEEKKYTNTMSSNDGYELLPLTDEGELNEQKTLENKQADNEEDDEELAIVQYESHTRSNQLEPVSRPGELKYPSNLSLNDGTIQYSTDDEKYSPSNPKIYTRIFEPPSPGVDSTIDALDRMNELTLDETPKYGDSLDIEYLDSPPKSPKSPKSPTSSSPVNIDSPPMTTSPVNIDPLAEDINIYDEKYGMQNPRDDFMRRMLLHHHKRPVKTLRSNRWLQDIKPIELPKNIPEYEERIDNIFVQEQHIDFNMIAKIKKAPIINHSTEYNNEHEEKIISGLFTNSNKQMFKHVTITKIIVEETGRDEYSIKSKPNKLFDIKTPQDHILTTIKKTYNNKTKNTPINKLIPQATKPNQYSNTEDVLLPTPSITDDEIRLAINTLSQEESIGLRQLIQSYV